MSTPITDRSEEFDSATSASICNAIGERLRQDLHPERSSLPTHLQRLLDEIHRRERPQAPHNSMG